MSQQPDVVGHVTVHRPVTRLGRHELDDAQSSDHLRWRARSASSRRSVDCTCTHLGAEVGARTHASRPRGAAARDLTVRRDRLAPLGCGCWVRPCRAARPPRPARRPEGAARAGARSSRRGELHDLFVRVGLLATPSLEVAMVTGDKQATAQAIAEMLGIRTVFAEVKPIDKARLVRERRRADASSRWSAMASTMHRRWPPPTSG